MEERIPSSSVRYLGDFNIIIRQYFNWYITQSPIQRQRLEEIYNKLDLHGYLLEDIQKFTV